MFIASAIGDFLQNTATKIVITIVITFIIQSILHATIGRVVRRAVRSHKYESKAEEKKREDTLIRIFRTASAFMLWLVAIIVILAELNVNIAALLTGAGLIGVVAGIAAQNVIKNYLAGLYIIMENQYRVGDIITLSDIGGTNGTSGVVEDISIRATRLRDLDGTLHIVTNGTAAVITNRTFQYASPVLDIGVSYDADIDQVEKVINEVGQAMQKDAKWQDVILEPIQFLRVDSFNDSSVTVKAVGKVKPGEQWGVAGEFRRRVKQAFDKAGIEIPFPQVVVHQPAKKA